tara:strand:+ start:149 stop:460 length:312 start_codon:yes stop_codon:yes gene_type:complete
VVKGKPYRWWLHGVENMKAKHKTLMKEVIEILSTRPEGICTSDILVLARENKRAKAKTGYSGRLMGNISTMEASAILTRDKRVVKVGTVASISSKSVTLWGLA